MAKKETTNHAAPVLPMLKTVEQMSKVSGIGENKLRELMDNGELEYVQNGNRRLIADTAIWDWYHRASENRRKAPGRARGLSYGNLNKTGKKQTRQQRRTDRATRHSLRRKHKVHRPGRKKEVVCQKGLCHQKGSSTA